VTKATGTIEVKTYAPHAYDAPAEGPALNEILVTETFKGDLTGEGAVRFLQAQRKDGSASFVGLERVSGALAGRQGTFLLQDEGTLIGDQVSGRWFVVEGSGTGGLAGLRGKGTFEAKLGEHARWVLDYSFDEAAEMAAAEAVSVVVARVVCRGREEAYEQWLREAIAAARRFPGHLGAEVLRPEGQGRRYVLVFRYETLEQLLAWDSSPERDRLVAAAEALCEGPASVQRRTGLEGWFTLPGEAAPPPRWKMALVTWLVAFPLIQALSALLGPLLAGAPPLVRSAAIGGAMVLTMTYAAMPLATRALRRFLFAGRH
jgi:antibiotic biosynthesis monooxygenase (ABM) superfamily enzyme